MSLHVVAGIANSGKTGLVHGAVRAAVAQRRSAALLLPSVPDVRRAQRELSKTCALGLEVQGFDRFMDELWCKSDDGRRIVARTQRRLLLKRALRKSRLNVLSRSAERPGFTATLETLIMRAAECRALRETYDHEGGAADELLAIIGNYARILKSEGLIERADAHHLVCDEMPRIRLPEVIAVNRFGNLTSLQERFCVSASQVSDVWVGLTWSAGFPATSSVDRLVTRLGSVGELHIADHLSAGDTPPELRAMELALFAPDLVGLHKASPAGAVVLSDAWGGEAEAARITCEIQEAVQAGVAAGDIAVVFRSPEGHAGRLRSAFRDAGIQAEFDLYVPLASIGIASATQQITRFFTGGGDRRDLIGFLRTAYSPAAMHDLDTLDAQLRRGRTTARDELVRRASSLGSDVANILGLAKRLSSAAITEEVLEDWRTFFSTMLANAYSAAGEMGEAGEFDARAVNSIMNVLCEMAEAHTLDFTVEDLLIHMREGRVALSSKDRPDRVQVLGAERMRGRRFSHVILGGLTANEFPRLPSEDALTTAGVGEALRRAGIDTSSRVDIDAERLLFYQVVTRARHKLVLSRRVSDEDGSPLRQSPLLEELLDLYRDPTAAEGGWYYGPLPRRTVTLADLTTGPGLPDTVRRRLRTAVSCGEDGVAVDERARLLHARWRARPRSPHLADDIAQLMSSRTTFTASQIEAYLGCPYRWYVQNTLRPEGLDVEFDVAARGTAAHEIMRRFYERLVSTTGERRVTPAFLESALQVYDQVAAEVLDEVDVVGLVESLDASRMARAARHVVEEDATLLEGFWPAHHEWSFGVDDAPEEFGDFSLRGRIDRIDVSDGGFVITDYKSGTVQGKQAAKFSSERLVQLPLYAEVARRRLSGLELTGAFYRSVLKREKPRGFFVEDGLDKARFTRTDEVSREQITVLIDEAVERAVSAVNGMRAGRIPREPQDAKCCDYCPARVYCEGAN